MPQPKYEVCPRCKGEGYVSKLGAFTGDDMDEWYGDNSDERAEFVAEYKTRGGIYDERCPACDGQRVVDEAALADWREREADQREMEREMRYGGSLPY